MPARPRTVLWHIPISHYSEKVRWALDLKRVPHVRRATPGGVHMAVAAVLTRGRSHTLPLLTLDGRHIADSSAIIAGLESAFPDPPLFPADPEERRRALELEDWFDEELGPHPRLLGFHELGKDPVARREVAPRLAPPLLAGNPALASALMKTFGSLRYGTRSDEAAEESRRRVVAGLDRLEAELAGRDHLVGDRFTIADLTAATLLYPVVQPPEAPHIVSPRPEGLERFRASIAARPGFRWVEETFRRYRAVNVVEP